MKQAMKDEDPNIAQLGQRLNSSRTEVLKDLKQSMKEHIPEDLLNRLTNQETINEGGNSDAQEDLEKVIYDLFELKLTEI